MFYPWNLDEPSGALSLFLSYSRALKSAGYRLDCYAPRGAAGGHGIFDNVFVMPDRESPVIQHLESLGRLCEDSSLPEKLGRDEASMAAAGVLAAISDYDVVGIQYTRCHSLRHMLPPGLPVVVFTHDLDALVGEQLVERPKAIQSVVHREPRRRLLVLVEDPDELQLGVVRERSRVVVRDVASADEGEAHD